MSKYRKIRDARDGNHKSIVEFLRSHGFEVIETERPVDCLVFNGIAGWIEIKGSRNTHIKRSQLQFMSETKMPVAFAANNEEALAFAQTMRGLTSKQKGGLKAFLASDPRPLFYMATIEKVLAGVKDV